MTKVLQTPDSRDYQFLASLGHSLHFQVKAAHDAHLCLTAENCQDATPMWEVFVGGWDNTKSAIRRDRTKPDRAEIATPKVLSKGEYRPFWLRWDDRGRVELGREGEGEAFLSYCDPLPFRVAYFGVRTAWGATGKWKIEPPAEDTGDHDSNNDVPEAASPSPASPAPCNANWVRTSEGAVPPGAVFGGKDHYCDLWVARAHHEGSLTPGKLAENYGIFIPFGGGEHLKKEYEVLCSCNPTWVQVKKGGQIPKNALPAGRDLDGGILYVGRADYNGTTQVGKVLANSGMCHVSYGGKEYGFHDYEILVQ